MGLGHGRHTKVDTVCSMAWPGEARKFVRKFRVGRARSAKIWVGSREARHRVMVCAGAREERRLHEDVLEMKVLLAPKPQHFSKKARFARALRANLLSTNS